MAERGAVAWFVRWCCAAVAFAVAVAWAAPGLADNATVARIDVTAYGLFEDLPQEVVGRQHRGHAFCPPLGVRHVRTTRYVPDSLFTRFGILFSVRGTRNATGSPGRNATGSPDDNATAFGVPVALGAPDTPGAPGRPPADTMSSVNASMPLPSAGNASGDAARHDGTARGAWDNGTPPSPQPVRPPVIPPRDQWPDKVRLELRIEHPLMMDPISGKASTVEVWPLEACLDAPSYAGWMFTSDWEQVRGDWTLSIHANGVRLASEVFQVVDPTMLGRIPLRVSLRSVEDEASDQGAMRCLAAGSFLNSLPRATTLARQLRGKGYPAFVGPPHADGGSIWHTVYLGGYAGSLEAGRDATLLRERESVAARLLDACPKGAAPARSRHGARATTDQAAPARAAIARPGGGATGNGTDVALIGTYGNTAGKTVSSADTMVKQAAMGEPVASATPPSATPLPATHPSAALLAAASTPPPVAALPAAVAAGAGRNGSSAVRVASDAPWPAVAQAEGVWWVVVGEHAGAMAAAGQAVRLRDRGLAVKVFSTLEGGALRYIVRVGPFADAQGARTAIDALAGGAEGAWGVERNGNTKGGGD
ncbi:MAG: DUF3859 domain-containing protein [Desulfovibrionaceae bacterium]